MELSKLYFNYLTGPKKFSSIFYWFDVSPETAESLWNSLENILDDHYSLRRNFNKKKKENAEISQIKSGYTYSDSVLGYFMNKLKTGNIDLYYRALIGDEEEQYIDLLIIDGNSAGILEVHDLVMAVPHLKISDEARIQVGRFNFLRSEGFNKKKYLRKKF